MSFPRYPAYKDSGVEWLGEVPAGWTVCAVRRILGAIEQGWSPDCLGRPATPEEWGVLKAGCVNRGVYSEAENKALPDELSPVPEYEVRAGDVLMSRASGSPELVGSTALVTTTRPRLMLSDKVFRLRLDAAISPSFFVAALNSRILRAQIERAISGADGLANNLPQSALRSFLIAVPPATEQRAIAAFLDRETARIDALVAEQERLIELLREKRQAVISHAVTKGLDPNVPMKDSGVEWLGEVPAHWNVVAARRMTSEHRQGYYTSEEYVDDGVPLLRITDILADASFSARDLPRVTDSPGLRPFFVAVGDFLFARTGGAGLFGVVRTLSEPTAYASYLIRFRFQTTKHAEYLRYAFTSTPFQEQIHSSIHGGVNQNVHAEDIKNAVVALPGWDEQRAIADYLGTVTARLDSLITSATHAITLLQERRSALITAAVTGQIDVRGVA